MKREATSSFCYDTLISLPGDFNNLLLGKKFPIELALDLKSFYETMVAAEKKFYPLVDKILQPYKNADSFDPYEPGPGKEWFMRCYIPKGRVDEITKKVQEVARAFESFKFYTEIPSRKRFLEICPPVDFETAQLLSIIYSEWF